MGIISKEKIDDCKYKVKFSYDKEKIDEVSYALAKDFGKKYQIKGYRKGKAPIEAVKEQAKKYLNDATKQKLVTESFEDIMCETKWKPFGQPQVSELLYSSKNFVVDMIVGHVPAFELSKYKDFDLEPLPENVGSVEKFKEQIAQGVCQEFGELKDLGPEDFVLIGDEVCIDYHGTIDGNDFENNIGENVKFVVGQNKAIDGLEDDIIGMVAGETRDIAITFADDFPQNDVKGKAALFKVTLKSAKRMEPCELNDELLKKLEVKDMAMFDAILTMKAKEKVAEIEFAHYKNQITKYILDNNEIVIPNWMKIEIAKNLLKMQNGKKWEELKQEEIDILLNDSEKRLKASFLFDKIKETEVESVMSDEELMSTINSNLGKFPEKIRQQLVNGTNPNLTYQIASEIQDEYLIRWLINHSNKPNKEIQNAQ